MTNTVQIRPEQAKKLVALNEQARAAERVFAVALEIALSGLLPDGAKVSQINAEDGTITFVAPVMEKPTE